MASQKSLSSCVIPAIAGIALVTAGCRGNQPAQGAPAGPPPSTVQVITLQNTLLSQLGTGDFLFG